MDPIGVPDHRRTSGRGLDALAATGEHRTSITERTWVCTNTNNQRTQERERETTTETQTVVSKIDRVRNQITGFILGGYGGPPTTTVVPDGPPLNSCPSGPWVLTTPAGDPVVLESSSGFEVSTDGDNWFPLQ